MYFRNYWLPKMWLNKSLKCPIWTTPPLPYLYLSVKAIELEKISLSDMQKLKNLCEYIEFQWQVFSS